MRNNIKRTAQKLAEIPGNGEQDSPEVATIPKPKSGAKTPVSPSNSAQKPGARKQAALGSANAEQAAIDLTTGVASLTNVYIWQANRQVADPTFETMIVVEPRYRRSPRLDVNGDPVTDVDGNQLFDSPHVNIQLKLPLKPEAISLPLAEAVMLPESIQKMVREGLVA